VSLLRKKPADIAENAMDTIARVLLAENFSEAEKLAAIDLVTQGYFTITDPATVPPYK
jgi:hypothetical protein